MSAFDGASNHGENHRGIIYELDPQAILYCSLQYARGTREAYIAIFTPDIISVYVITISGYLIMPTYVKVLLS